MKRLVALMIASVYLFSSCISTDSKFDVEEEDLSWDSFVENEMVFSRSMETKCSPGTPNVIIETDADYEVGSTREEYDTEGDYVGGDADLVVVKADNHCEYLLTITVNDKEIIDEYYSGIEPDERGVLSQEVKGAAFRAIPLSDGFYCEVYAEKASNIYALDHITITESEKTEPETRGERRTIYTHHYSRNVFSEESNSSGSVQGAVLFCLSNT